MAYDFVRASNQYLEVSSAPVLSPPFTLSIWFNSDGVATVDYMFALWDASSLNNVHVLRGRGDNANDPIEFVSFNGTDLGQAFTTTGFTAGTWHHALARAVSNSSRNVLIDGGSQGSDTTSVVVTGLDRTGIGRWANSSDEYNGGLAEPAIWDVALSDAEVQSLAIGFSPKLIRPQNLVFYAPLIRSLKDEVGGLTLTNNNGASVIAHDMGIIYPTKPMIGHNAGAVPAGNAMPMAMNHYRRRRAA